MDLCGFEVGPDRPLFLIAGPCVIESERMALETAETLRTTTARLGIGFIYKSSFDKANRTSDTSFRGLGLEAGLRILERVREEVGVAVLTDVHEDTPIDDVAAVVDVLQTPAFLCRQTNFIRRVAAAGRPVNIKKGQFLAPWDMVHVVEKARSAGNERILVCERGVSFGYNYLVSDMRSLAVLRETGCPVVFDATHSVQMPGGMGAASGGQREFVPVLARAAVAAGVSGIFMETHPNPDEALSDGPNAVPLAELEPLLETLVAIDRAVKPDHAEPEPEGGRPDERAGAGRARPRTDRGGAGPRNHRFARQPHRRGGGPARGWSHRIGRRAVRCIDRSTRGGRASRRRPGAIRGKGGRAGRRQRRTGNRPGRSGRGGRRAGAHRCASLRARRHLEQGPSGSERDSGRLARDGARRRRRPRTVALTNTSGRSPATRQWPCRSR